MTLTNAKRAERFFRVLATCETDNTFIGCLIDILADARHWCDRSGHCYADLDRQAHQHYLAELGEEQGGRP